MAAKRILDEAGLSERIDGLVTSMLEDIGSERLQALAIIGIHRRGVPLAERIADRIAARTERRPPTGTLDITLYRDDLTLVADQPLVHGTEIDFPVDGLHVVLVDDVLFTGRTVRAAIDALLDLGRPAAIKLAVLADRGHRELPIQADYVGESIETGPGENVHVHLREVDGQDLVEVVS